MRRYKILAQSAPVAGVYTELYRVPDGVEVVVSTVTWVNRSRSQAVSFRLAVIPRDQAMSMQNFIIHDHLVPPRRDEHRTIGLTLSGGDTIHILTDQTSLSISMFGGEIDVG